MSDERVGDKPLPLGHELGAQPSAPAQREPVPDFEVWRERALLAEDTIKQWGPLIRGWLEPRSKDLNMVLEENAWLREKFENLARGLKE